MSRLTRSVLVTLILLALILDTVVEAKKVKRHSKEKNVDDQKSPSKSHVSSLRSKEEKVKRWRDDKLTRGKRSESKNLELDIDDLGKQARSNKREEYKARVTKVKKDKLKNGGQDERMKSDLYKEEMENIPEEYNKNECRNERDSIESTDLSGVDDNLQMECLSSGKEKKQKKTKCGQEKSEIAEDDRDGNCNYE